MGEMGMMFKFIIDGFISPGASAMWIILFLLFGALALVVEKFYFLFVKQ